MTLITITILSGLIAACEASAPAPTTEAGRSYSVISEQADPSTGALLVSIKVSSPVTQLTIKTAAESAIAERRASYPRIIVKSFSENSGEKVLATSTLEGGSVSHRFNSQAETERIQTH